MSDNDEVVTVAIRAKDIKKVVTFCVRNKIPITPADKANPIDQLVAVLNAPAVTAALNAVDKHLERSHEEKMAKAKLGKGKEFIDVDYEEVNEEPQKDKKKANKKKIVDEDDEEAEEKDAETDEEENDESE